MKDLDEIIETIPEYDEYRSVEIGEYFWSDQWASGKRGWVNIYRVPLYRESDDRDISFIRVGDFWFVFDEVNWGIAEYQQLGGYDRLR